jgi:hypothetical protein
MEKEIRHERCNALLRNVSGLYNTCNNYVVYHINQAQDPSTQSGNDFAFLNLKSGLCISPLCNDQKEPLLNQLLLHLQLRQETHELVGFFDSVNLRRIAMGLCGSGTRTWPDSNKCRGARGSIWSNGYPPPSSGRSCGISRCRRRHLCTASAVVPSPLEVMAADEDKVTSCKERDGDERRVRRGHRRRMRRVDEETGATGGRWWRQRRGGGHGFQMTIYRTRPGYATGLPAPGVGRNTGGFWCSERSR